MAAARQLRRRLSRPEYLLWLRLRRIRGCGLRFRRQHAIGSYVADFTCAAARIVVEIDGSTHDHSQAEDAHRSAYFGCLGLRTVRLPARAVIADADAVAEALVRLCTEELAGPSTTQPDG